MNEKMKWQAAAAAARAEPVASKLVAASQAYSAWVQAEMKEWSRERPSTRMLPKGQI